jgi:hypothetical protein
MACGRACCLLRDVLDRHEFSGRVGGRSGVWHSPIYGRASLHLGWGGICLVAYLVSNWALQNYPLDEGRPCITSRSSRPGGSRSLVNSNLALFSTMLDALFELVASFLVEFLFYTVLYRVGWAMLKAITLGSYPPPHPHQHNQELIALLPVATLFVGLTFAFS